MAKGNLFLGTARRSVGDVVLYRRNGEQVSRVRVRKIGNPKSDGQALQRSYMAAVSKFYSYFKAPLEKSWQGLNKSRSQSAFLKANANLMRSEGYYIPKGFGLAPLPLQVSKGTITRVGATIDAGGDVAVLENLASPVVTDVNTLGTISAAFIAKGYAAGDQVTILTILYNDDIFVYEPHWCRFVLDPTSQENLESLYLSVGLVTQFTTVDDTVTDVLFFSDVYDIAATAVIVSRYSNGEWQRSTEFMASSYIGNFTGEDARAAAIASYQSAVAVPESDVYLNGSTTESSEPVPAGVADFTIGMFSSNDLTGAGVVSGSYTPTKVGYRTYNDVRMLNVTATNNANGKSVSRLVVNRITGNADLGKVYTYAGAAATAPAGVASAWPIMSATDPLVAWLAANGITLTIPT